ncbi:MAG: GNAT family N-acetyltransferase [Tenericutes bacterium]|nr:GNAT family N-acetyltransferase [Mycoplasmatota bacterium]
MNLYLKKPTPEDEKNYIEYIKDWKDEFIYPTASSYGRKSYQDLLDRIKLDELNLIDPDTRVPASTYMLVDEFNEIYGFINIRHRLNEDLLLYNGNVGYGVKPTKRHQGYGKLMLKLGLEKAKELGLTKVLITCNEENIASRKTIEANHGVLENKVYKTDGYILRYWIDLIKETT